MLQFYSTNIINVKRFINIENNNKDTLDENEKKYVSTVNNMCWKIIDTNEVQNKLTILWNPAS